MRRKKKKNADVLHFTHPGIREFLLLLGKERGTFGLGIAPIDTMQLSDIVLQGDAQAHTWVGVGVGAAVKYSSVFRLGPSFNEKVDGPR